MAVEYLGLSSINGPLAVLEGVSGAAYDEIVEMSVGGNGMGKVRLSHLVWMVKAL